MHLFKENQDVKLKENLNVICTKNHYIDDIYIPNG